MICLCEWVSSLASGYCIDLQSKGTACSWKHVSILSVFFEWHIVYIRLIYGKPTCIIGRASMTLYVSWKFHILALWGFSNSYWCVLRREWMGCWGLLEWLLLDITSVYGSFPHSLRLAPVRIWSTAQHLISSGPIKEPKMRRPWKSMYSPEPRKEQW